MYIQTQLTNLTSKLPIKHLKMKLFLLQRNNTQILIISSILILIQLTTFHVNGNIQPENPIKCTFNMSSLNTNCTITNSMGLFPDRTTCRASQAIYPTNEIELINAVAQATENQIKIKVATRYSHSIPKLVCPDGTDGLVISMRYLNRVLSVNISEETMTVESGMTLRELMEEAGKANLALPNSPYWWGLTVGGMIGTGAHGSSLWGKGSQVHDYVTRVRIISPGEENDGFVKVRTLESGDKELHAVKVSLGVLGVISQVTLKLQPMFKRSVTNVEAKDDDLGERALKFGREHEFGDIIWHPSQRKVVYRMDDRVSLETHGNGVMDLRDFRSVPSQILTNSRTREEILESRSDAEGKCNDSRSITSQLSTTGYGLTNDGVTFTGYPVIGYQNRIQASGSCLDSPENSNTASYCVWDPRTKGGSFFYQSAYTIALSKVKNFIEDVQKLVSLEPKSLCGLDLYTGIVLRYITASSAYLGKQEDGIDFMYLYYRSKDPLIPRLFQDILDEIEQMALFKYNALPHWGKNKNVAFEGAIGKFKNAQEFLKIKKIYDPLELFSSDWTDQILGLKPGLSIDKVGCALEGLCICSKDVHCAPDMGYFCRPGKVYKEARVCTKAQVV